MLDVLYVKEVKKRPQELYKTLLPLEPKAILRFISSLHKIFTHIFRET